MIKVIFSIMLLISPVFSNGKMSGVSYFDYTYDLTEDAPNDDGFSLSRTYLTYKNDISDELSYKFQTDVGNLTLIDIKDDRWKIENRFVVYLKKAQLDWKSPIGKITLGMQGMNMFNVKEKTWGFRFLEKSPMDLHKFSSSADMGVGYSGKMGDMSYSALMTNGSGYKSQEDDKFKKYHFKLFMVRKS